MITVPKHFQFRIKDEPGYTHTGKIENGNCTVVWARGFERYYMDKTGTTIFPVTEWSVQCVADQFVNQRWVLSKQPEAKQEGALPDEFYFTVDGGNMPWYKAASEGNVYRATWAGDEEGTTYPVSCVEKHLRTGDWKIIEKHSLTAEQQRANKEFREQIAALEQSIKLNQGDIEHKQRLINSYEERKAFLLSKIVEEV